ncbi:hypothetical protein UlMin_006122 [Ulmus minor]
MVNWRRRQGDCFDHQAFGLRSDNRRPPPTTDWRSNVPSWERDFCYSVGLVHWGKIVEAKKYMHLNHMNIVKWNDSAGEEAFNNAKSQFWAKINGLPCDIPLPDPNKHIDEIDWNATIDPDLLLDLELELEKKEPKPTLDQNQDEQKILNIFYPTLLSQTIRPTGWGDEEDVQKDTNVPLNLGQTDSSLNYWETNWDQTNVAIGYQGTNYGWNDWDHYPNQWGGHYYEDSGNFNVRRVDNNRWGTWAANSGRKEGTGFYSSRQKNSRFQGDEFQNDRGRRDHRGGGRKKRENFGYGKPPLKQWNMKTCAPKGGNPLSLEKPVL